MKTSIINTVLFSGLLALVACGSKESSMSLKVSAGFTIGSEGFTGGVLAHGVGPGTSKFSMSASTGSTLTTTIADGTWKIFVVGWDGSAPFTGTKYCGVTEVTLGQSDTNLEVTATPANCSGTSFSDNVALKNVFTTSCAGFYEYSMSADTFTTPSNDTFCPTLPTGLSYSHSHYRLIALNQDASSNTPTPGVATGCISTDPATPERRELPVNRFPFRILTYPSLIECQNTVNPQVATFDFPHGLMNGNPGSFDHLYQPYSTNLARVAVPSSMTRRGRSPFMSMIPRILCGSSTTNHTDCVNTPSTGLKHVYVPFNDHNDNNNEQLLLKGVKRNASIPAGFLNMPKFGVENVEIKDGNIFGSVYRNKLMCQDTADFGGIRDIYYAASLIYVLQITGSDSTVRVFTLKGKEINKVFFPGVAYNDIAVSSNQTLYLAHSSTVAKFPLSSGAYLGTPADSLSGTNIQDIELNGDGTVIAVALDISATNYVATYQTSDFSAVGTNQVYTSPMKQMQFSGNYLYTYSGSGLKKYAFSNTLSGVVNLGLPSTGWEAFTVNGSDIYGFTTAPYQVHKFAISDIQTVLSSSSTLAFSNSGTGPKQLLHVSGKIILADSDNATLQMFETGLTPVTTQEFDGECNDTAVASIDGISETLTLTTNKNDSIFRIFSDAYEAVGVRSVVDSKAFYAFREFRPHGTEIRTGGRLSHVQQMLGPDGISSFVSDFQDCNALLVALTSASENKITRTRTLFDSATNSSETYTAVFKKINENITNTFYCKDNTYSGTCGAGTDIFNIEVMFNNSGTSRAETVKMKLSCNRKVGSLENLETDNGEERRELTLWNTGDYTKARYESYSANVEDQTRGDLFKVVKNGVDSFWNRKIHLEEEAGGSTNSTVMELQLGASTFLTKAFHLSDNTSNFAGAHSSSYDIETYSFDSIRDNLEFNALTTPTALQPAACMSLTNVSMSASPTCSAVSFSASPYTTMSANSSLLFTSADSLAGISSNLHPIWDIFEIP